MLKYVRFMMLTACFGSASGSGQCVEKAPEFCYEIADPAHDNISNYQCHRKVIQNGYTIDLEDCRHRVHTILRATNIVVVQCHQ